MYKIYFLYEKRIVTSNKNIGNSKLLFSEKKLYEIRDGNVKRLYSILLANQKFVRL